MLRGEDPALGIQLGLRIVRELEQVHGFPPVRVGVHTGPASRVTATGTERRSTWPPGSARPRGRRPGAGQRGRGVASRPAAPRGARRAATALAQERDRAGGGEDRRGAGVPGTVRGPVRIARDASSSRRPGAWREPWCRRPDAQAADQEGAAGAHTFAPDGAPRPRSSPARECSRASVDEVAEEAGYTKGAFYANFKSKEELFLAMLDERFDGADRGQRAGVRG